MQDFFSLRNEGEYIYGVEHKPEIINQFEGYQIIFLHGWSGYRTGPHDMFVKLARRLSQLGFACIRFDFRGRGFSEGNQFTVSFNSMKSDIDAIVNYVLESRRIKNIILVGICSGALLGLHYIINSGRKNICQLIEISSPPLDGENNSGLELNRLKSLLREYAGKAVEYKTYKKMLTGQLNYKRVLSVVGKPLKKVLGKKDDKKVDASKARRWNIVPSHGFDGRVLCIHGELDPETSLSTEQISRYLKAHKIGFELDVIVDANHSFYSIEWEKLIILKIESWLLNNIPR